MNSRTTAPSRTTALLFCAVLAAGFIVFSARLGVRMLVPEPAQRESPYRFVLAGGASEIGGTPGRGRGRGFRHDAEWETTQDFPFRVPILEAASAWNRLVGWNVPSLANEFSPFAVSDGYLSWTTWRSRSQRRRDALNIARIADWFANRGLSVLYATPPTRLGSDDRLYDGVFDFASEQNAALSRFAETNGIAVLDLAEEARRRGLDPHDSFYGTDHHFTDEAARWISEAIAHRLSAPDLGVRFPAFPPDEDWSRQRVPGPFLGSIGRRFTLSRCSPEILYLPTTEHPYSFSFEHVSFSGRRTVEEGGFDVFYRRAGESFGGIYQGYRFNAVCRGSGRIVRVRNLSRPDGPKLFFAADSYDNAVIPFLACVCSEIVSVDGRNGDLEVSETLGAARFDAVVILFNTPPGDRWLSCFPETGARKRPDGLPRGN